MLAPLPRRARAHPGKILQQYYEKLLDELGPQGWWPARTRLEIVLGAILTQNTTWNNAALALKRLRKAGLLTLSRLLGVRQAQLEELIRPAGFFRQKASAIRNFLDWLAAAFAGSLGSVFKQSPEVLRSELLDIRGLGPETVDAILLYAGRQPFFVADAYTRRILARHDLLPEGASYEAAQTFLHRHLPADPALFNEFHALLVEVGKRYCRRRAPCCQECPLQEFLLHEPQDRPTELTAGSLHSPFGIA